MLNRKARFEYEILEEFLAGIILFGPEVKSIRAGKGSINEAYCLLIDGDMFIRNMHIDPYKNSVIEHDPKRDRKLLLNKAELEKIGNTMIDKGLTIIPLEVKTGGLIKIKIGIAKGKKLYDKRESIKEKDAKREMQREASND
jgi:SsrA-binding protein